MATIKITAAVNSGNETTFNVVDSDGVPVNLTTLGATVVAVTVCGDLVPCEGSASIDSDGDYVSFSGTVVTVAFGKLALPPSPLLYSPKISYITLTRSDPEVIAGDGYKTAIALKVVC